MKGRINNFDRIAGWYDMLSSMVFGGAILNSQKGSLEGLELKGKVLFLGGGTGKVLPYILKNTSADVAIDYVEASQGMINIAKQAIVGKQGEKQVRFIRSDDFTPRKKNYDVVLTFYFLDVFRQENLYPWIDKIAQGINERGVWCIADFSIRTNESPWQSGLVNLMYVFFRWVSNLEGNQLYDYPRLIEQKGFRRQSYQHHFHRMIFSAVLMKE